MQFVLQDATSFTFSTNDRLFDKTRGVAYFFKYSFLFLREREKNKSEDTEVGHEELAGVGVCIISCQKLINEPSKEVMIILSLAPFHYGASVDPSARLGPNADVTFEK